MPTTEELNADINALAQSLTDELLRHSVRITAAQEDATGAKKAADAATTRIYESEIDAQFFTTSEVQKLRDQFAGILESAIIDQNSQIADTVLQNVLARLPNVEGEFNQALAELNAAAEALGISDLASISEELLNNTLPNVSNHVTALENQLRDEAAEYTKTLAGFEYETISEGVDAAIQAATDAVLPVGYSVLRKPYAAWTQNSSTGSLSDKLPAPPEHFVTNDPVFGEAYAFPVGNNTIGQSYPVSFSAENVYRLMVRVRASTNGTAGEVAYQVGASTWGPGSPIELNVQAAEDIRIREQDGDVTAYIYVVGKTEYLDRMAGRRFIDLTGSTNATQVFFHVRQNPGNVTDGRLLVALLDVRDVTDAFKETNVVFDQFDTTPPAVTQGIQASSFVNAKGDAEVTVSWTDGGEDVSYYELEITEESGNPVVFATSVPRHKFTTLPGTEFTFRARSADRFRNASAYGEQISHVAAADTEAPGTPTGLNTTSSFGTVWLDWDKNEEPDLAQYHIYEAATATPVPTAPTEPTFTSTSTMFLRSGLGSNKTYYYWIRAVDRSGNASPWSAAKAATTLSNQAVTNADLQGLIDETSFANGATPVEVRSTLPGTPHVKGRVVVLTTNNKIYRNTGTGWTAQTSAEDILGQLVSGQLGFASVGANQIAAKAMTAKHFGVGDFSNYGGGQDVLSYWNVIAPHTTAISSSGKYGRYIRLSGPGSNIAYLGKIECVPDEEFYVSFVGYVGSGWDGTDGNSKLRFGDKDANLIAALPYSASRMSGAWKQYEMSFKVPDNVTELFPSLQVDATTGYAYLTNITIHRKNAGTAIIDGTLKSNHFVTDEAVITGTAQIANAIIDDAKIANVSAGKLKAGTALANTITVNGDALGTIRDRASDPASRINSASTKIDPGRITISGSTTLTNWIKGGDETRMDGGEISANTIAANALKIGQRGITLTSIEFEHNSPSPNRVSWTSGSIRYTGDNGEQASISIASGSAGWSSGIIYIYWSKGNTFFSATSSQATATGSERVIIATYQGGRKLDADYGRTIIDGTGIKTGTLTSQQVNTESFAVAGLSIFGGDLRSTTQSSSQGWSIFNGGFAEFKGVVISRPLIVDSGSFDVSARNTSEAGYFEVLARFITWSTAVSIDEWNGARETYLAEAGFLGGVETNDSASCFFGIKCTVLPLTRFSGNQSLRLESEFIGNKVSRILDGRVDWRIYKVT